MNIIYETYRTDARIRETITAPRTLTSRPYLRQHWLTRRRNVSLYMTTSSNGHLPRYLQVHVESRRPSSRHEEGKRMAAVPSAQSHDVDTTALATGLTRPASNSAGPATQGTVALNLPRWENLASARGLHWCKWPYHMITTFLQIFLMRRNCQ